MFGQFKNILPNNIRSISDSVGINEEEWRTRGLERLEAIRSEFQNLLLNRPDQPSSSPNTTSTTPSPTPSQESANRSSILELESVAQLIDKFRNDWHDIHERNHANFSKFEVADRLLIVLLERCQQHANVCKRMDDIPNDLSTIQSELHSLTDIAGELKSKLATLEDRIEEATAEHTRGEFEAWKRQEQVRVKEELAEKRVALARREAELKEAYEQHNNTQTQKRVELYEATFNAELEDYRRRRVNEVSSLYSHTDRNNPGSAPPAAASLDSVRLDSGDIKGLDMFLTDDENALSPQATTTAITTTSNAATTTTTSVTSSSPIATAATSDTSKHRDKYNIDTEDDDDEEGGGGIEILGDEDYHSSSD